MTTTLPSPAVLPSSLSNRRCRRRRRRRRRRCCRRRRCRCRRRRRRRRRRHIMEALWRLDLLCPFSLAERTVKCRAEGSKERGSQVMLFNPVFVLKPL